MAAPIFWYLTSFLKVVVKNYAATSKRLTPPEILLIRILVGISLSSRFTWEIIPTILPVVYRFFSVDIVLYMFHHPDRLLFRGTLIGIVIKYFDLAPFLDFQQHKML